TTNNRAVKSARRLLCYLTAVCIRTNGDCRMHWQSQWHTFSTGYYPAAYHHSEHDPQARDASKDNQPQFDAQSNRTSVSQLAR
ncbi:MAG: hypothetical protein O3B68_20445, partial [Planctomycetota bacterium]|nr:hypothetical protein [Planctomycetota bacterium]